MGFFRLCLVVVVSACVFCAVDVHGLSVCPVFEMVRDAETGATMAVVQNEDVFSRQRLWDGETSLRVPLDNFQRAFPACFPAASPYGDGDAESGGSGVASSNSFDTAGAGGKEGGKGAQPLVTRTTSKSSKSTTTSSSSSTPTPTSTMSVGATAGERIVALPYARNPPPGDDYCTSENALVSVGGTTYCNNYAQFVLAEEGSTITPLDPECVPPNCYPCAADPTGLGVYASRGVENQQTYCDPDFGLCFRLFVCVPNIGCRAHAECACGQECAKQGTRATALGASAATGGKQWYYISDAPYSQPIFNNTLTGGGGGRGCCTFAPREPVCRFQSVTCQCLPAYTPANARGTAQSFENKNRISLQRDFREAAAEISDDLQCCTGAYADPAYYFDSMVEGEYVKYTVASRCQNPADVGLYQSGVNPVQYAATASFGRTDFDDVGTPPDATAETACVRVWRGADFTDVSAYICTGADGRQGRYGKLEWLARANPADPAYWWQSSYGNYNAGKIGQWNADIRSFVVPKNAEVTFFQNNWFGGNSAAHSGCQCADTKSNKPCCNGKDWNISSLTIRLL